MSGKVLISPAVMAGRQARITSASCSSSIIACGLVDKTFRMVVGCFGERIHSFGWVSAQDNSVNGAKKCKIATH